MAVNWYEVIKRTAEELPFYERQGIIPSLRKMYYRLVQLKVLPKTDSNYSHFSEYTAEARRGIDSTYTKPSRFPKLPIDCFRGDKRDTKGNWDMSQPYDPTPDEPPDDPIEVANNAIKECKYEISRYDGLCEAGDEGVMSGRWYMQPTYCQMLCESETIQPDLLKIQEDRQVKVAATREFPSTPFLYEFCKELKQTAEKYDWTEKIVILYFGDFYTEGQNIRQTVENALKWYSKDSEPGSDEFRIPVPVELRLVAIRPEQVEKFRLTGNQIEAFMTTKQRLKDFKEIVLDAIDECWDPDIYDYNCPDEEFDYEANGMEEPEDINPDNEFYEDTQLRIREKMCMMATEAFRPGWDRDFLSSKT